ncbi:hypothetical protein ACROYT_G007084 [Oculina patagonica]
MIASAGRLSAQRFGESVVLEKMASGGEESSRNNQENQPEEDEIAVVQDTEGVFRHFMFQRFQDETQRDEELGEMSSPSASARPDALEELRSCNDVHPFSQHVPVIGRRLGEIGDEIDAKYKDQFKDMIDSLSLTPATAYETFAAVARRLFRSGINWGRVVALLCFGYEIAVTVIRRGFSGSFLRRIIRFVVDFIFNERIARWIAQHGGWRAVLDFRLSEPSWYTVGIVLMLGTMAAFFAARKT